MTPVIEVDNISKNYGKVKALDGVSFTVEEGELFGLIGPDGAGKSTLYNILTTLKSPDSGTARVEGIDIRMDYRQIRRSIGYMPERFSLYPDLTVSENLNFFASLFGVSVRDNYELIAPIYSQLAKFPNRRAGALSGGMKQKLALSCALIHRPGLLLLDEPTTGVDAVSRSEFWDMLDELRKRGMSFMVSTSYMDEAEQCDRIALISKGRILGVNTPESLTAELHENLWNVRANEMYRLLEELRKMPQVRECYTFGATLHVVGSPEFDPDRVRKELKERGIQDVEIYPAKGNIEDLFIKLAQDD